MQISSVFERQQPAFSFEFFPPKTDEGVASLFKTIERLQPLQPAFVSVTYGAGGSTRDRTLELVTRIKHELDIEAMAHLTCVGSTRDDLRAVLDRMAEAGLENVLALRGDPPRGETAFVPVENGFSHATELMEFIAANYSFCIGGACYPEVHLEGSDLDAEVEYCRLKVAQGARFLITQLFYDNAAYFEFVARARRAGIAVPIVPGIMPLTSAEQIERITSMCGAKLPSALRDEISYRRQDQDAVMQLGVSYATLQCADLLRGGAPGIHFYTLNRSPATSAILSAIKLLKPWEARDPAGVGVS